MPVATSGPSGRAMYEQATAAFVRNMPLEALCIVTTAIEDGKHRSHPRLAEQYLLLKLTALFTVYTPNDRARLDARVRQWRRQSSGSMARRRRRFLSGGRDNDMASSMVDHSGTSLDTSVDDLSQSASSIQEEQLPVDIQALLDASPALFLARVWVMCLRFSMDQPLVPSIKSSAPSEAVEAIASDESTLLSAVQLPPSVCEALVAGALKMDAILAQEGQGAAIKSKKPIANVAVQDRPGLQASRAMCEWILAAYAQIVMEERSIKERSHLQDQYSKVLRMYSLEILGRRVREWEYAREVVRCAQVLAPQSEIQQEMQEREKLLCDIQEAERNDAQKDQRRVAAKEYAQTLVNKQVAARAASIQASSHSSAADISGKRPRQVRQDSSSSVASASSRRSQAESTPSQGTTSKTSLSPRSEDGAMSHHDVHAAESKDRSQKPENHLAPDAVKAVPEPRQQARVTPRNQHGVMTTTMTLTSLRDSFVRWLRSLGPVPAVLCSVITVLLILRRVLRGGRPTTSSRTRVTSGGATPSAAELAARHRQAMTKGNQGVAALLWRKIADTLKMGTQVTYL